MPNIYKITKNKYDAVKCLAFKASRRVRYVGSIWMLMFSQTLKIQAEVQDDGHEGNFCSNLGHDQACNLGHSLTSNTFQQI